MTTDEADELLSQIADMALQIEEDAELERADPRYSILAKWIETNLDTVSVPAP